MFGLTPVGVLLAALGMLAVLAVLLGIRTLLGGMTIKVLDERDELHEPRARAARHRARHRA